MVAVRAQVRVDRRGKRDPAYRCSGNLIHHAHAVRDFQQRQTKMDAKGYKVDVLQTDKYETTEAEFLFVPYSAFEVIGSLLSCACERLHRLYLPVHSKFAPYTLGISRHRYSR